MVKNLFWRNYFWYFCTTQSPSNIALKSPYQIFVCVFAHRNSTVRWMGTVLFHRTYCQIETNWYLGDVWLKFTAMHHAPGCIPQLHVCIVDSAASNSCKHTAARNALRVRGQCQRVIANQRAAARTILTVEVGACFILYEEQIGVALLASCVKASREFVRRVSLNSSK